MLGRLGVADDCSIAAELGQLAGTSTAKPAHFACFLFRNEAKRVESTQQMLFAIWQSQ
jgi:hypothetical protein